MGEYTPKPWSVTKCKCGHECCTSYHVVDKNGHTLGVDSRFDKEDAELIAKAVNCHDELLEACKNLVALLDSEDPIEVGCHCTDSGDSKVTCIWCKGKTAIAKAEGGV